MGTIGGYAPPDPPKPAATANLQALYYKRAVAFESPSPSCAAGVLPFVAASASLVLASPFARPARPPRPLRPLSSSRPVRPLLSRAAASRRRAAALPPCSRTIGPTLQRAQPSHAGASLPGGAYAPRTPP